MQFLYNKTFNYLEGFRPSNLGIYFSLILHLSILLFALGFPDFFKPKKIFVPKVIPIEILNISDVTSLSPKKNYAEIDNKQNKTVKQKKFNSSESNEIKKVKLQEKPKVKNNIKTNNVEEFEKKIIKNQIISDVNQMLQKPELKKISLKEKQINKIAIEKSVKKNEVETLKIEKIKPKLKPKPLEKIEIKTDIQIENKAKIVNNTDNQKIDLATPSSIVKPESKPIVKPEPKPIVKPEPDFNLATMLKDLRNEDISNISKDNNEEEKKIETNEDENEEANIEISISEMDLVLQQLRSCFNPRAGTQIVGDEMVKISAKIDRQAFVRKDTVQIIATNISKSNPYYEAITESALATLYNPLCSKLKLPLNKYDSWKNLKITIDYSWIKN